MSAIPTYGEISQNASATAEALAAAGTTGTEEFVRATGATLEGATVNNVTLLGLSGAFGTNKTSWDSTELLASLDCDNKGPVRMSIRGTLNSPGVLGLRKNTTSARLGAFSASVAGAFPHIYSAQTDTNQNAFHIAVNSANGDVWMAVSGVDIFKLTGGAGSWVAQNAGAKAWRGIDVNPTTGDVWATAFSDDVYKSAGGTGAFTAQSAGAQYWIGIAVNPTTGDVWLAGNTVGIFKRTAGVGAWVDQSAGTLHWYGIDVNPVTGDVWANVLTGDTYKNAGGTGTFDALSAGDKNWVDISVDSFTGNVWATDGASIWKMTGGTGAWAAQGAGTRVWYGIDVNPTTQELWSCVYGGYVYKGTPGLVSAIAGPFSLTVETLQPYSGAVPQLIRARVHYTITGGDALFDQTLKVADVLPQSAITSLGLETSGLMDATCVAQIER